MAELHRRASQWYEDNGLEIEAFHHATAANDIERAARLIEGQRMPLHFRGGAVPILNWLESLPTTVLDARPSLWVMYASATLTIGHVTGVEQKVQAAEAALQERRARRQDPRPYRTYCLHTSHVGCHSASGRNHHYPVAPSPGVFAPRQPARTRCHYMEDGICISPPGRPCRGQPGLYRSHVYLRSDRAYRHRHDGCNRPGQYTGIRKPAVSGGRDLPTRPAIGR